MQAIYPARTARTIGGLMVLLGLILVAGGGWLAVLEFLQSRRQPACDALGEARHQP